jgi:signal transduction histidine kinase
VVLLAREVGRQPFSATETETLQSFAAQAAVAMELAERRRDAEQIAVLQDRDRIARDLHDLAIQQLFATGMQLETIRRRASRGVDPNELLAVVDAALDNVDGSVRQIRQIVRDLRDPDGATGLVERLRREASLARTGLGFAPSFVVTLDGVPVSDGGLDEDRVNERVDQHLTSDVVAVVREGLANAARHAQATTVTVRVGVVGTRSHGCVEVVVEDDGVGIPSDVGRSSGTRNLAARAHQHGGTFAVGTRSDRAGTRLTWEAPLR